MAGLLSEGTKVTPMDVGFGTERVSITAPMPTTINTPEVQKVGDALPPVPDTQATPDFSHSLAAAEGAIVRANDVADAKLNPSVWETASATSAGWVTTRLAEKAIMKFGNTAIGSRIFSAPKFDNDTPLENASLAIQHLSFIPTAEEQKYLAKSKGVKEFQFAAQLIQEHHAANRVAGAGNTLVQGMTSFVDPIFFVLPAAFKLSKLGTVSAKAVSAGTTGAIASAAVASQQGPVSDAEVLSAGVISGMFGGLLGGTSSRAAKVIVSELDAAAEQTTSVLRNEVTHTADGAPTKVEVSPAVYEDVHIPEVPAVVESKDVITSPVILEANPRLSYGNKGFGTEFANPMDKAAFMLTTPKKSAGHNEILNWVKSQGWDEATLVKRGREIREDFKAQIKAGPASTKLRPTTKALGYEANVTLSVKVPRQAARTERRLVKEAVYEDAPVLPPELQAGAINTSPEAVADAVVSHITKTNKQRGIASTVMWNMHKELSKHGAIGKQIADLLVDNNANLSITSLESHREATLSGLRTYQYEYEDMLRSAMAEDGFGTFKMLNPLTSRKAYQAQLNIETELKVELMRREQAARTGIDTVTKASERVNKMADKLDEMHRHALKELKDARVSGAAVIEERAGYLNRKWSSTQIDAMLENIMAKGVSREVAESKVHELISLSLARGNNMDTQTANEIAGAIYTRAMDKGYFEDTIFNSVSGMGTRAEIGSILREGGTSKDTIERVMAALTHQSDEAGKAGILKHRMDLDYNSTVQVGGDNYSVMDLIDGRVTSIVDQYNRRVATSAAFARKGFADASAIDKLRSDFMHSIKDPIARENARDLFDNIIAHLRGEPSGAKLNDNFRLFQAYGRTISLAYSGLWQATEYATAMAKYGILKSFKYMMKSNPDFGRVVKDGTHSKQLNKILSMQSSQNMRMRPFISRYEDGFEMSSMNAAHLSMQVAGDLVPMANAMKYIHHHQAELMGNLVVDRLEQAASGSTAAREELAKYGLESHVMDKLSLEIDKHGYQVDLWDSKVWADTRPTLAKMMGEGVLKERLGDMPSFAKFDPVGKLLFTYRSFTLVAHNKLMAGSVARDGASALGLLLLYQLPLTYLAVSAQQAIKGKPQDEYSTATAAVGQMGGLGLLSEPFKIITGQSNAVGSAATIPIDRGIKLTQSALAGNGDATMANALSIAPVLAASPVVKLWEGALKED